MCVLLKITQIEQKDNLLISNLYILFIIVLYAAIEGWLSFVLIDYKRLYTIGFI